MSGILAIAAGAILTVVGLTSTPVGAFTGPVATPNTSASNQASYWGPTCVKLDQSDDDETWVADGDYAIVVLKSGTTDYAFYDVVAGDVLTIPQDISHFIFCPPTTTTTTVPETTTTVPETTTTVAETTTTVAETTTTVAETTTTVAETTTTVAETTTTVAETTTTSIAQQGPTTTTTTSTVPEESTTTSVAQQGPTTTVSGSGGGATTTVAGQLPATGGGTQLAVLGGLLVALGVTLLSLSRRRTV